MQYDDVRLARMRLADFLRAEATARRREYLSRVASPALAAFDQAAARGEIQTIEFDPQAYVQKQLEAGDAAS